MGQAHMDAVSKLHEIFRILIGDSIDEWNNQKCKTKFSFTSDWEWAEHLLCIHKQCCTSEDGCGIFDAMSAQVKDAEDSSVSYLNTNCDAEQEPQSETLPYRYDSINDLDHHSTNISSQSEFPSFNTTQTCIFPKYSHARTSFFSKKAQMRFKKSHRRPRSSYLIGATRRAPITPIISGNRFIQDEPTNSNQGIKTADVIFIKDEPDNKDCEEIIESNDYVDVSYDKGEAHQPDIFTSQSFDTVNRARRKSVPCKNEGSYISENENVDNIKEEVDGEEFFEVTDAESQKRESVFPMRYESDSGHNAGISVGSENSGTCPSCSLNTSDCCCIDSQDASRTRILTSTYSHLYRHFPFSNSVGSSDYYKYHAYQPALFPVVNNDLYASGRLPLLAVKCEICGKVISNKWNLKLHKMIHINMRPFRCTKCGKTFRHKQHLQRHLLRVCLDDGPIGLPLTDDQNSSITSNLSYSHF